MAQMVRAMRTIFQMESLSPSTLLTSNQLDGKINYADFTGFQDVNRKLTSEDEIDALEVCMLAKFCSSICFGNNLTFKVVFSIFSIKYQTVG